MKRYAILAISVVLMLALSSCAHVISKETRAKAASATFGSITADIEKHKGSLYIFGGTIASVTRVSNGTMLELVQKPIDKFGEIYDEDASEGRFLAFYKNHLDPMIYRKHRNVTIAGVLTGTEERKLGEATLNYPAFDVKEIYLWREEYYFTAPGNYQHFSPWYPFQQPYPYPYTYPYYYPPP